jgi:uncharacterized phage protein (TIGR01671 family)
MREILFRGKRIDNGEWAYGYYVMAGGEKHYIVTGRIELHRENPHITFEKYEVIPETVGEYSGLKDKNGVMIFEGDIVKSPLPVGLHSNGRTKLEERVAYVFYSDLEAAFRLAWKCVYSPYRMYATRTRPSKYKIIGNIHDNPELLEADNKCQK